MVHGTINLRVVAHLVKKISACMETDATWPRWRVSAGELS